LEKKINGGGPKHNKNQRLCELRKQDKDTHHKEGVRPRKGGKNDLNSNRALSVVATTLRYKLPSFYRKSRQFRNRCQNKRKWTPWRPLQGEREQIINF